MRTVPYLCFTLVLIGVALFLYDRLRSDGARTGRDAPDEPLRPRLERLESRVAALVRRLEQRTGTTDTRGPRTARRVADPRLHAAAPSAAPSDATVARWKAGLQTLQADRLKEDERRYVERRLRELEADWTATEHAAATQIVLEYLRARATAFRRIQKQHLDPTAGQVIYDEITRTHQARLLEAIEDDGKARAICNALLPLRD